MNTSIQQLAFYGEVAMHVRLALRSYNELEAFMNETDQQRVEVWQCITSLLVRAAMVDKYMANKNLSNLAASLKARLGQDFIKRAFREARNNVEHADERFASWVKSNSSGRANMVHDNRADFDWLTGNGDRLQFSRALLMEEMIFLSHDRNNKIEEVDLRELRRSLEAIERLIG